MSKLQHYIEIKELYFRRGERIIFDSINVSIPKGKITAIIGPSGCGKTTLLRHIGAQLKPEKGTILVAGQDLHSLRQAQLFQARQKMGMLFQSGALFTDLTVFENVAFPLREHTQLPEPIIRNMVLMKLQSVGLRGAREMMPSELSGGMARRVALARAIILDPELMLYDEPLGGLDPISLGVIVKLIKQLNDTLEMTSIIVTHDITEVFTIADWVYMIADGKVIAHGTPAELQTKSNPQVKQFVEGLPDGVVPFHHPSIPYLEDLLA